MKFLKDEIWTLAGVIITLSGEVRSQAIWISLGALLFWIAGSIIDERKGDGESGQPPE
jgi:hypothetical protein